MQDRKISMGKMKPYLLFILETVVPFILLGFKMWALNTNMLHLEGYRPAITAFSFVIVGLFCLLIRLLFRRSHVPAFMTLYCVISILMFLDSIYCGYTNKLPEFQMLQYTGLLRDVSDAIIENITFTRILYAIDVPVWIAYFLNFRSRIFPKAERREKRLAPKKVTNATLSAVTVIAAGICIGFCMATPFVPSYFKSEIISYHTLDGVNLLLNTVFPNRGPGGNFGISEPGTPVDAEISPYWGLAAGRNVITIQVEALQNFVLGAYYNGQELTPNLNKMLLNDTIYFDHYYYQIGGGNTADAEFAVNNSLYAPETEAAYSAYPFNDYYSMATLLKDNGYKSATAFHGFKADFWSRNIAYPGQGYDAYLSGDDYFANPTETTGLGITDGEFFRKSVEYMKTQKTPFYAFLITLSSHYSFDMKPQFISLEVAPEDEGTLFANYMRSIHYVDQAFGMLLDELKAAGLYENSVITIYGDHFALPVYNADCKRLVTALTGRNYTYAQHFNVPLIIHIPGSGVTETCSNIGGHIDVMPTLLHLLGLENRKGVMLGYNILTTTDGAVFEQTHLARGSFFWGNTMYMFPFSGIAMNAEAYALDTGEKLNAGDFVAKADEGRRAYELGMYILENDLALKEKFEAAQNK